MSTSIFHSPFTTALSGSAKETEDRIRNIFQYQKKRPPVPALLLACALALSCGGLVSCQSQNAGEAEPAGASSDIERCCGCGPPSPWPIRKARW